MPDVDAFLNRSRLEVVRHCRRLLDTPDLPAPERDRLTRVLAATEQELTLQRAHLPRAA